MRDMRPSRLALLALGSALLYLAAVTWYLLVRGGAPTPDFLIPPLLLPALLLRKGRAFLLDWTPFLLLILAWESTRGIADRLGMPVQITAPVRVEEALFFGHLPTVLLQDWLYDAERGPRPYDWLGALLYSLHFVLPVAFGFALWLRGRALFQRYAVSLLSLFLLGFVGYVLVPQAPPWIAGELGVIPFTHRIGVETLLSLPAGNSVILVYERIRPNEVAAMPSLHAALPLLLTLILWRLHRALAAAGVVYTLVLGFFLVYHGEHYVIDLIAGWALAGLVYWLVWATPAAVQNRLPRASAARRRALALPATALAALLLVAGTAAALRPGTFGGEPVSVRPQRVAEPPPPVETAPPGTELVEVTGPCGSTRSLAGLADELLGPAAWVYAAYLIDVNAGACLALTAGQSIPPPDAAEQRAWTAAVAQAGEPLLTGARGEGIRLTAVGTPSSRLAATGLPPGQYLLVVSMREVPDANVAREAAYALLAALLVADEN